MERLLIAILLTSCLAACHRNASDQPIGATDTGGMASPATVADSAPMAPAGTTDATTAGPTSAMGTTTDTGPVSTDGAATGATGTMPTGQSDATLEADLQRCDTMVAADQATCRTDAQSRYEQRAASGDQSTPPNTP